MANQEEVELICRGSRYKVDVFANGASYNGC